MQLLSDRHFGSRAGKPYYPLVDFLKFVFAILIMCNHTDLSGFGTGNVLAKCGYLGVEFFFIISGFFLASDAFGKGSGAGIDCTVEFYRKRIRSFFPYFWSALIFDVIIECAVKHSGINDILTTFIRELFEFLPLQVFGFQSAFLCGTQWFVGALFVALPLVYILTLKLGKTFSLVFGPICAAALIGRLYLEGGSFNTPGGFICGGMVFSGLFRAFAEVTLGTTVFSLAEILRLKEKTLLGNVIHIAAESVLLVGAIVLCFIDVSTKTAHYGQYIGSVFIILIGLFLVLYFSNGFRNTASEHIRSVTAVLGSISSVLFLVHIPIGRAVNSLGSSLPERVRLILYFVISNAAAFLLYESVSFLKKKKVLSRLLLK